MHQKYHKQKESNNQESFQMFPECIAQHSAPKMICRIRFQTYLYYLLLLNYRYTHVHILQHSYWRTFRPDRRVYWCRCFSAFYVWNVSTTLGENDLTSQISSFDETDTLTAARLVHPVVFVLFCFPDHLTASDAIFVNVGVFLIASGREMHADRFSKKK